MKTQVLEQEHLAVPQGLGLGLGVRADAILCKRDVLAQELGQTRGKLVYCAEDPVAFDLCKERENAVSYGWEDADYTATDFNVFMARNLP